MGARRYGISLRVFTTNIEKYLTAFQGKRTLAARKVRIDKCYGKKWGGSSMLFQALR